MTAPTLSLRSRPRSSRRTAPAGQNFSQARHSLPFGEGDTALPVDCEFQRHSLGVLEVGGLPRAETGVELVGLPSRASLGADAAGDAPFHVDVAGACLTSLEAPNLAGYRLHLRQGE